VVTPRHGKAVEINALWYNALRVMEGLARRFGEAGQERVYGNRAAQARAGFEPVFWNEAAGCLYDVVDGDRRDGAVRPNQIFAVSLPHPILGGERARRVVDAVQRALLTPVGLRSLAPSDAHYHGRYAGDVWSRDGAYHQGTVWGWLIGPFVTAYVNVRGRSREGREEARGFLSGLHAHLKDAGLGSLSEIFDGDPPHLPRGCVAQAWSVAEALRAYVEDVLDQRPENENERRTFFLT
jgi:glycogen debranching enzyme